MTKKNEPQKSEKPEVGQKTPASNAKKSLKPKLILASTILLAGGAAGVAVRTWVWAPAQNADDHAAAIVKKLERRVVELEEKNQTLASEMAGMVTAKLFQVNDSNKVEGLEKELEAVKKSQTELLEQLKTALASDGNSNSEALGALIKQQQEQFANHEQAVKKQLELYKVASSQGREQYIKLHEILTRVRPIKECIQHGGKGFNVEHAALQNVLKGVPELKYALGELENHAAKGVVSEVGLADEFDRISMKILKADKGPGEGAWEKVKDRLSKLVTVRKLQPEAEDAPRERYIAEIMSLLKQARVAEALTVYNKLDQEAKGASEVWWQSAKAHLAAKQSVHDIELWSLKTMAEIGLERG